MTDYEIVRAMIELGGSFVVNLADAWGSADEENRRRIKETWPELWTKYAELAKLRAERQAAQ